MSCPAITVKEGDLAVKLRFKNMSYDPEDPNDWLYEEQVISAERRPETGEWGGRWHWKHPQYTDRWSIWIKPDPTGKNGTIAIKWETKQVYGPQIWKTMHQSENLYEDIPTEWHGWEKYFPVFDFDNGTECELSLMPVRPATRPGWKPKAA